MEYRIYPFKCDDNNLLFGPEVDYVFKCHPSCNDYAMEISPTELNTIPIDCYNNISYKSIIDKVNETDWMRIIFKKTCFGIQEEVYRVYMKYSYPCCKMGYPQFFQFMTDQKIETKEIRNYFK